MQVTVLFLALFALIATSYAEQPAKHIVFSDGEKGPDDTLLETYHAIRIQKDADGETSGKVNYGWGRPNVHISYVEISEVGSNTKASAKIASGGVGSNGLTFEAVPGNDGAMNFELQIWGHYE